MTKFTEKGNNVVVIGCSPAERIRSFASETNFDANLIYSDPSIGLYKALGMVEAKSFSEIKGKGEKSKESVSGTISGLAWSLYKSLWHKSKNVYQLGGTFIVDNESNILFKKIDSSSEDHAGVEELFKEANKE